MIRRSQEVHLLLILPSSAANHAFAALDEVDVLTPQSASFGVASDFVQDCLEAGFDSLAVLSLCVVNEREEAAEVVEIRSPKAECWCVWEGAAEQRIGSPALVLLELEADVLDPY